MSSAPTQHLNRLGNLLVFFGGGHWRDIADHDERASYATAGFIVLVNAAITWVVLAAAVVAAGGANPVVAVLLTVLLALLVGAFGRVLASRMAQRGGRLVAGDLVRALVAVVLGVLIGELAALALFTGPVDAELNRRVDDARAGVATSEQAHRLENLKADKTQLDRAVDGAIARRDDARVVARCEYNPTADCPAPQITGDPGTGQATTQAEQALASAEGDLANARAERAGRGPELDAEIAVVQRALAQDRHTAETLARTDNGVDARWLAMHEFTAQKPVALTLRVGVDAFFVLLNLLPLLLRLLRGETPQDSLIRARRQRLLAEIEPPAELPALSAGATDVVEEAEKMGAEPQPDNLPENQPLPIYEGALERIEDNTATAQPADWGPLTQLPGPLPRLARALTGVVRPLVPERISMNPVKTARTLLEEVEEIRFSLTRRRTVTVHSDSPEPQPRPQRAELTRSAKAERILDAAAERSELPPTEPLAQIEDSAR